MSEQGAWVGQRVAEARKGQRVTDAAVNRMLVLVSDQFQERPLSASELGKIATALIADMMPSLSPANHKP